MKSIKLIDHLYDNIYYIRVENKNNIPRVKLYLKHLGYENTHRINSRTKVILVYYKDITVLNPDGMLSDFIVTNEENFINHYKPYMLIPERIEKLKSIL